MDCFPSRHIKLVLPRVDSLLFRLHFFCPAKTEYRADFAQDFATNWGRRAKTLLILKKFMNVIKTNTLLFSSYLAV